MDEGSKQASTPINAAPRSTTAASARARAAHAASARSMGVAQLRQLEQSRRIAESALQRSLSGFVLNKDDKFDMRMRNRVALLWTLGGTFMYYAVSLGFYNVFYFAKGYERWDSTVIHSPVAAQRYAVPAASFFCARGVTWGVCVVLQVAACGPSAEHDRSFCVCAELQRVLPREAAGRMAEHMDAPCAAVVHGHIRPFQ